MSRRWRVSALSLITILLLIPWTTATAVAAGSSSRDGYTYRSASDCQWTKSVIGTTDGGRLGVSGTSTKDLHLWTPWGGVNCGQRQATAPAGQLALRLELWKWNGSEWNLCATSDWDYNETRTNDYNILAVIEDGPPCGRGWYGLNTYGYEYNGEWHGGIIYSGDFYY